MLACSEDRGQKIYHANQYPLQNLEGGFYCFRWRSHLKSERYHGTNREIHPISSTHLLTCLLQSFQLSSNDGVVLRRVSRGVEEKISDFCKTATNLLHVAVRKRSVYGCRTDDQIGSRREFR